MSSRPFLPMLALVALQTCSILDAGPRAGDLTFEVREVDYWSPGPAQQIVLLVYGDQSYPCMNYQIESDLSIQDHSIRVAMTGAIKKPEVCLTAIGPAIYRAALGIGNGAYELEFVRQGLTDRYVITVTEMAIQIMTRESHFTRPAARSFPRL
jgi:hypothetical protein